MATKYQQPPRINKTMPKLASVFIAGVLSTVFLFFTTGQISLSMASASEQLIAVDFEVFGKVQGVFFRKYTAAEANKLGLGGWCKNTPHDTVQGVIEGKRNKVAELVSWLQKVGSPQSKITKAVFTNERSITHSNFDKFTIKR